MHEAGFFVAAKIVARAIVATSCDAAGGRCICTCVGGYPADGVRLFLVRLTISIFLRRSKGGGLSRTRELGRWTQVGIVAPVVTTRVAGFVVNSMLVFRIATLALWLSRVRGQGSLQESADYRIFKERFGGNGSPPLERLYMGKWRADVEWEPTKETRA
jgi:hypothetical protein